MKMGIRKLNRGTIVPPKNMSIRKSVSPLRQGAAGVILGSLQNDDADGNDDATKQQV